jgi:hypothetical protein
MKAQKGRAGERLSFKWRCFKAICRGLAFLSSAYFVLTILEGNVIGSCVSAVLMGFTASIGWAEGD